MHTENITLTVATGSNMAAAPDAIGPPLLSTAEYLTIAQVSSGVVPCVAVEQP
jgi:hypothetical protein